jgi:hypothetical protein
MISKDPLLFEMSLSLQIGFLPKIITTMVMHKDFFTNIKLEQQTQKLHFAFKIIQLNNQLAK